MCLDFVFRKQAVILISDAWIQAWLLRTRTGGGGGFFLTCKDLGRKFHRSFPTTLLSFLSGDQLIHTNSTLFNPWISPQWLSVLRWLQMSVPDELHVSSCAIDGSPHCLDSVLGLFIGSRVYAFGCILPPALLAEWLGSYIYITAITRRWSRYLKIRSRNPLPGFCQGWSPWPDDDQSGTIPMSYIPTPWSHAVLIKTHQRLKKESFYFTQIKKKSTALKWQANKLTKKNATTLILFQYCLIFLLIS